MSPSRKIINDPVHGFITIDDGLVLSLISHPWYQRLRRIHQMAFAQFVYPGAMHTRLLHSLGAYHLMCNAIAELKSKGTEITPEEERAAQVAILLHDIGHGPYSHALENILVKTTPHEDLSLLIMQKLNEEFNGALSTANSIFTNKYEKKFLHQLVSGQLDVDRMDYLIRDSFFTGVSEGIIGYDRILKMLTVHKGQLMVEEKGIYSVEKFLVSRRLMYWQVYLHKTVLSAEQMLIKIMLRAQFLARQTKEVFSVSKSLDHFLKLSENDFTTEHLELFCKLDDIDVLSSIKQWTAHKDKVLSTLCTWLINRQLFKVDLLSNPIENSLISEKKEFIKKKMKLSDDEINYFVFDGIAENRTYNTKDEHILILFKNGTIKDISSIDNALIHQSLALPVKKFYFCYPKEEAFINI